MPQPLISIIVPVYNAARFLPRCLESLLGQTYANLEIICVNDGSSDDSLLVLEEYAARDARIKVIHQENAGAAAARNRGLDVATGEYLTFVDSDDWVEFWGYERVISAFTNEVDLVFYGTALDGEIDSATRQAYEKYLYVPYQEAVFVNKLCEGLLPGNIGNKVWRRSVIEKKKLRFIESLAYCEDECFFFFSLSLIRKITCLSDTIYHYVWHPGSTMSNKEKQSERCADDAIRGARYILDYYKKEGVYEQLQEVFLLRFVEWYALVDMFAADDRKRRLKQEGYRILREGKLTNRREFWAVRDILRMNQKKIARVFCQYIGNRVCYGIGRLHVVSITYGEDTIIYRILGRIIWIRRNKANAEK